MAGFLFLVCLFVAIPLSAQAPATMKQLMVDLIYRPQTTSNLLMMRGRARDQGDWMNNAKMLVDAGTAAYNAAQAKDVKGLAALAESLDNSCTTCHKQYRPNVFPR